MTQWPDILFPGRWTVYGRRLRPFSLGHLLLLHRMESPVLEGEPTHADAVTAALLCSVPWTEAADMADSPPSLARRASGFLTVVRCFLKPVWALRNYGALVEYIHAHMTGPMTSPTSRGAKAKAPALLRLHAAAVSELGLTPTEALDHPPSVLTWLLNAVAESRGAMEFLDEDDEELLDRARRCNEEILRGN